MQIEKFVPPVRVYFFCQYFNETIRAISPPISISLKQFERYLHSPFPNGKAEMTPDWMESDIIISTKYCLIIKIFITNNDPMYRQLASAASYKKHENIQKVSEMNYSLPRTCEGWDYYPKGLPKFLGIFGFRVLF